MTSFSTRHARVPRAATMAAAERARTLQAQGREIISLTLGEPDFPTPPHVVEAAHAAARNGETKYPPLTGTPALKDAVARKFYRDSGLAFGMDQILVANGGRQIIYDALTATLNPGDEIVVPAPYWNAYPLTARMAGATPVFMMCSPAQGFLPQPHDLASAITPRTKWVVLNYPNNPTGAVMTPTHLLALAETLRRAPHVWIMSDDMYEHLVHDGAPAPTLAALAPDLAGRTLTLTGVSKTYAMTGWRVGFAGGPAKLIAAMANVQGQSTGGVSPVCQAAAAAALDGPQTQVADMRAAYAQRSARVVGRLRAMPGVTCHAPGGAFYAYPSIAGLIGRTTAGGACITDDAAFCEALLLEAGVAAVHGGAFGASPYVRISTAASASALERAMDAMARLVDESKEGLLS